MEISTFLHAANSDILTKFKIAINPGLKMDQVRELENEFSIALPNDFVVFYLASNGLEADDFLFNILPLNKIEKATDDIGDYLVFAEYMIFTEYCGLEIDKIDNNKYRIFNTSIYSNENGIVTRKYITESLLDFVKLYCTKGTYGIWGDDY